MSTAALRAPDQPVTDHHTEIERAAFQPNNTIPGTGLSPGKMPLARGFSSTDAHLGVDYQHIPVNRPKSAARGDSKDGQPRNEVPRRAFEYWRRTDKALGDRGEAAARQRRR
jgi:catalase